MNSTTALPDRLASAWIALDDLDRLLLRSHPGAVLLLTPHGDVLGGNPAAAERLGLGGDASPAFEADALLEPQASEGADAPSRDAALQPGAVNDWTIRHRDRSTRVLRLAVAPLRRDAGDSAGLIAIEPWPRDADDAAPPLHHHDSLTGLPTAAVLADRAEMALQRAARVKSSVAVLLVRIAGFEAMCREHGASVGDDLLRATASRLHFELRKTDTAARLDNGQFVVMLVDLHAPEEATQVAGKIRQALSAPVNVGVARLPLSVDIGVACSPADGDQLLTLMQAAEAALGQVSLQP